MAGTMLMSIWHRIKAAFVPGVAAANAFGAKCASFEHAVNLNGFFCVARAGGFKTTGLPEKRAKHKAVGFYEIQNYRLHRFIARGQRDCKSGVIESNAIADNGALATTTKSCASNDAFCSRKFSLI